MAGAAAGAAFPIELIVELDAMVSTAAHASDHSALDADELTAVVLGLELVQSRLDAARAHATAELDDRSVTETDWGLRTGGFIAHKTHTPTRAAKRRVHVSRRLRDEFPVLDQALADGRVSWAHVDMFCHQANPRITDLLTFLIPDLINLAADIPFLGWATELRRIAVRLDIDGGHNPNDDITANKLFLDRSLDGTHELHGRFLGALGASLAEMLEQEADRQYRQFKHLADITGGETDMPPRATLRAFALAELCRKGIANTLADTNAPVTDLTLTHHSGGAEHGRDDEIHGDQRYDDQSSDATADADADADADLDADGCDGTGAHIGCGDRCNTHLRTAIRRRRAQCNDEFITLDGTVLTGSELGCCICDPTISLLQFSGNNAVLNLQRTQRLANREQRRALAARDGGCVFPGCDCPISWTDKHHVDWWENGGFTDLRNFACLCRFHHGVTHRQGWKMVANGDGTFTWTTPAGRALHSQSHTTRTRGSPQLLLS